MFDGAPEQFHQLFTCSRTSSPIIPSSLFPSFEPYPQHQTLFQPLPHNHHQLFNSKHDKKEDQNCRNSFLESNIDNIVENSGLWSEDEVLTLLRIRSSMESWFPEFTWEHVSRKLEEVGFKRSAEKCKEKFEEESRNFNSLSYNKNYRIDSGFDEIYDGENADVESVDEKSQNLGKQNETQREGEPSETEEDKIDEANNNTMENEVKKKHTQTHLNQEKQQENMSRKRKRKYNFKEVKLFCETVVNKIMDQQEELQNKLIEEMLKRDQEVIEKEEAWKNQEYEKLNKEIEMINAKQQAIANETQTMLLEFLKKFTSDGDYSSHKDQDFSKNIQDLLKIINNPSSSLASPPPGDAIILPQNPIFTSIIPSKKTSNVPTETRSPQNSGSIIHPTHVPNEISSSTQSPNFDKMHETSTTLANSIIQTSSYKEPSKGYDDIGKRWPKDEVLALINLRCSFNNNNNISNNCDDNIKESGGVKCSLWESISQGMEKLGYKRSSKRCKEKWENINKYFKKTKDSNKKRSFDSRTCPYFHQLSRLYSHGTLVPATGHASEKHQTLAENCQMMPENNRAVSDTNQIMVKE